MAKGKSLQQFGIDLDKFDKSVKENVGVFAKKVTLDIHAALTKATPVREGRAKGNWFPSVGKPAANYRPIDHNGKGGLPDPESFLPNDLPDYPKMWVTNNVPYIVFLDQGSSTQAPANFVSLTVQSILSHLK